MKVNSGIAGVFWIVLSATAFGGGPKGPDMSITLDPSKPAFKDQRKSRTAPDIGYAGTIADLGPEYFDAFFVKNPDATWHAFKAAGAHFVKEWNANKSWEVGRAYAALKTEEERAAFRKKHGGWWANTCGDPKIIYDWRKKHGVKVLLCLEQYGTYTDVKTGARAEDIESVKRSIVDFVRWIVDNGYRDQVAGFELGNEPFFCTETDSPEVHASRWAQIVPEIKRIFPECNIGIPIAEYRAGDPDIAAVRARSTAVDKWFSGDKEFGFKRINQWSGRFIVAFSNQLHNVSHVIYHFYGGDAAWGCGPAGYGRIRSFAKVFPEIKDKRVWITEWRERSDEDVRCQQMHSSSIFKAHYMLSTICQPEIDGICLHTASFLSGGFCITDGRRWHMQIDEVANHTYYDPDGLGLGNLRIVEGPVGPVFKLYTEALMEHPLIYDHGVADCGTITDKHYWSAAGFYAFHHKMVGWLSRGADPKKKPSNEGNAEWVLTMNPQKTSVAMLVCNSMDRVWKPKFTVKGYKIGKPHYRTFRCKEEHVFLHQVPGEPKPTWEEEYDGDVAAIEVPAYTIATIEFPIRRGR